ncbi:peptidoglycan DD-metalloendopeptidase family protein [Thiomicrorhabdus sp. zzn3]|uniref:peptidoglycan DD-metalloendopeptidase family protein n=1 Tax=Thiomicrorhabdus sp. zzn3 TaxID=3039775 RepID=UPI0024366A3A|nr:peptidoglycan DD-metalloendopeptidase family protein [Thiomicrorhabdus sp. zzn3]MDG6778009.1 peptidoglycan DD-metalloendopeptidase family protein [Thiomicrorhabdus sp. zzn3]
MKTSILSQIFRVTPLAAGLTAYIVLSGCSSTPQNTSSDLQLIHGDDPSADSRSQIKTAGRCRNPYRVHSGDTLSGIAVKCNVNMDQLAYANNLLPPYTIYAKQKLILPGSHQAARDAFEKQNQKRKQASWQWPSDPKLQYRFITDPNGLNALEIYGLPGIEITSVEEGEVVYAGNGIAHYGLLVMIKHTSGYISTYAHNSRLLVREGQKVKAGDPVATLGASGDTPRPKLYLEARYRGRKVDVKKLLKHP